MRQDMNFFSAFTKKKSNDKTIIVLMAFIAAVALFILITCCYSLIATFVNHRQAEKYIAKLDSLQAQVTESNLVNTEIDGLTKYNTLLTDLNDIVKSREVVDVELLDNISSALPSDFNLGSLEVDNKNIKMSATAKNKTSIAEFQHNLKNSKSDRIQDVQINSITWDQGKNKWNVAITCTLKEDK